MRHVTILDTSVSSDNLGDEIIMDAVRMELEAHIPDAYFHTVATHDSMGHRARRIVQTSEFCVVGGTNILSSNVLRGTGWKTNPIDLIYMRNVVMMGVGWRDYQREPTSYAKLFYNHVLSKEYAQSARDDYTRARLANFRHQTLNTSCPTLWQFTDERCKAISSTRSSSVLTTLTYYRPNPQTDIATLKLLQAKYDKIYFWSQQYEDLAYLRSLGSFDLQIIDPNKNAYSSFLRDNDVDYVGSRLHGGIRALQNNRRALIISIDNRAAEIGKDTNLPITSRENIAYIEQWIENPKNTNIRLPLDAITHWRNQFKQGK